MINSISHPSPAKFSLHSSQSMEKRHLYTVGSQCPQTLGRHMHRNWVRKSRVATCSQAPSKRGRQAFTLPIVALCLRCIPQHSLRKHSQLGYCSTDTGVDRLCFPRCLMAHKWPRKARNPNTENRVRRAPSSRPQPRHIHYIWSSDTVASRLGFGRASQSKRPYSSAYRRPMHTCLRHCHSPHRIPAPTRLFHMRWRQADQ